MNLKRKGMASMMDAMLFIVVLGIAVSVIFVHVSYEPSETSAKDVHDDLFRTQLRVSDVFDIDDDRVMPLCDLLVAYFLAEEGRIIEFILNVLNNTISGTFFFTCAALGSTIEIGSEGSGPRSSYHESMKTPFGTLETSLWIW